MVVLYLLITLSSYFAIIKIIEYLRLLGGDGGVPVDELGEHSAQGLNTQGQGGHVEQEHVSHVASKDTALIAEKICDV